MDTWLSQNKYELNDQVLWFKDNVFNNSSGPYFICSHQIKNISKERKKTDFKIKRCGFKWSPCCQGNVNKSVHWLHGLWISTSVTWCSQNLKWDKL